ncbi:MAG: bifunctional adenosylcobinamide kinase/adenosylcobinamide-phosphate guanylyltransferase [Anaerovoracaceae bacterium]|nr:bifunctional adenosylcobinamide kinase/adenosylcobinamide-phosphate guanylyltransferase [Bacillota bacterium]MDY2670902.1 bifunctional adenosylcobinamide kinase/adenosylcobinamide-phosphate guanylyltransferase [Anaerovoracaceae bacterium]
MEFITGGAFQGKLEYALKKYGPDVSSADAAAASADRLAACKIVYNLQDYIREHQLDGACFLPEFREDAVIICDEVGSGVIPMEKEEREYREAVGRACCALAEKADSVTVVRYGIARRIK